MKWTALLAGPLACVTACSSSTTVPHEGERAPREYRVTGTVTDAAGHPVGGASVAIFRPFHFRATALTRTGSDGRFSEAVPQVDDYAVTAVAPTGVAARADVIPQGPHGARADLRLTSDEGSTIGGVVRRPDGAPAAGAVVRAERWDFPIAVYYVAADDAGRYGMRVPSGAPYALAVEPGEYVSESRLARGPTSDSIDFVAYPWSVAAQAPPAAVVDWMRDRAIALDTVMPGAPQDDLVPVTELVGDARIVGLGESTHGTHEFFQLKHRLIEYLVEREGFTAFAIEANLPEAVAVDDYVTRGEGDPSRALAGLYFWTVDTQEVLAMIEWMRAYNADPAHERKVHFFGLDCQKPHYAAAKIIEYVERTDAGYADAARNALELFADEQWGRRFGELDADGKADARSRIRGVIDHFDSERAALEQASSPREWVLMRQFAVVVAQAAHLRSPAPGEVGVESRDRAMADNAAWIVETAEPGARLVIWAHNGHVSRATADGARAMGSFLGERYGAKYVAVGLTFGKGAFQARSMDPDKEGRGVTEHRVELPAPHFFETALQRTGYPQLIVDLRSRPHGGPVGTWFAIPHPLRAYGSEHLSDDYPWSLVFIDRTFDAVAFVAQTTRAQPTPSGRRDD